MTKSESTAAEKFRCEACGKRFASEEAFREHSRQCIGVREGRVSGTGEKVRVSGGARR